MRFTLGRRRSENISIVKSFARLIANQSIIVVLITICLVVSNAYSADSPGLPALPELPKTEKPKVNKNIQEEKTIGSFFKKFFGIKKPASPLVQPKEQKPTPTTTKDPAAKEAETFIDLDNKKLPALENISEKPVNSVPQQLDNNNPLKTIKKKDSENIDNLIPSLPADFPDNLDSAVPMPTLKETLPPFPAITEEQEGNQSSAPAQATPQQPVAIPLAPPVTTPDEDKASSPKLETTDKELPVPPLESVPLPLESPNVESPNGEKITPPVLPATPATPILPLNEDKILPIKLPADGDKKGMIPLDPPSLPPVNTVPAIIPNLEEPKSESVSKKNKEGKPSSLPAVKFLEPEKISTKPIGQTPIPVFVKEIQSSEEKNSDNIKEKNPSTKIQEPPLIPTPVLPAKTPLIDSLPPISLEKTPAKKISNELTKFTQDEIQMLLYQNDELVLGVLTEEARIEQMDAHSFIQRFKQIYDRQKRKTQRKKIDNFIANYNIYFRLAKQQWSNSLMIDQAFDTIRQNNLVALKAMVDSYSILQKSGIEGFTLLHEAANVSNYYIAKFLIIRGINMTILDEKCRTALDIAEERHNSIGCLIRKARGIKQVDNLCVPSSNCFKVKKKNG